MLESEAKSFLKNHLSDEFSLVPIKGDASLKQFLRVKNGDKSFIFMKSSSADEAERWVKSRDILESLKPNIAPKLIERKDSFFLLEDLSEQALQDCYNCGKTQVDALSHYNYCVKLLCLISKKTIQKKKRSSFEELPSFDPAFFLNELDVFFSNLFIFLDINPDQNIKDLLKKQSKELCDEIFTFPTSLQHRDFHSKNILIKDESIRVIDFQDLRWVPCLYDLVSLTEDSYVLLPVRLKASLKKIFYKKSGIKSEMTFKEFSHFYNLQAAQRSLKACGSFMKIYNEQSRADYLPYLVGCYQLALSSLEECASFSSLITFLKPLTQDLKGASQSKL